MRSHHRFWPIAAIGLFLSIYLSIALPSSAQSSNADGLNQSGFNLLGEGSAVDAFSVWEEAEDLYRAEGDEEGVIGTQLNQALAQQALGMHPMACKTLVAALKISERLCRPEAGQALILSELAKVEASPVNTIGIRLLGEGLGSLSNLEEGRTALLIAQERATELSEEKLSIELALANNYNLSFQSAWQAYNRINYLEAVLRSESLSNVVEMSNKAIAAYEEISSGTNSEASAKANVSSIGLLTYVLNNESDDNIATDTQPLLAQLINAAEQSYQRLDVDSLRQLSALDGIYTRLNLATNLIAITDSQYSDRFSKIVSSADISNLIKESTVVAERIGERRALSAAYGAAGDALKHAGLTSAVEQYRRALTIAQSIQANDLAYNWAYQLAQLSTQQGAIDQTEQYYEVALADLSAVRADLLAVNSELRFNFRGKIEPVYENYMQFLVTQKHPDLGKVVATHNSLQLAQLENLLRCGRLLPVPATTRTTIHIINLASVSDTIEVIVEKDDKRHRYSVPAAETLQVSKNLAAIVQSSNFLEISEEEFLPQAKLIYARLLEPAREAGLLSEGSELSFILDAPFQAIPIALLHDGQQYLTENHPLSISLQIQQNAEQNKGTNGLFAGLSKVAPSFYEAPEIGINPLPETEDEAFYVDGYIQSEILLDESFTTEQLAQRLTQESFDVVHISTHGQFSSDPKKAFLLSWDERVDFQKMSRILARAKGMNLLFLSACETAAGDERAALGLAGLAIQSGAKNAIATLWAENSTGGSVLVNHFYEELSQGASISEALQEAQMILMKSDAFSHPYYWAPFVLASS